MKPAVVLLLTLLSLTRIADALPSDESRTLISGFGTLGWVYNSRDDAGFIRNRSQMSEADRQYSWRPDSRIGLQIAHSPNPQWQLVGQLVARDQYESDLDSAVSRAFASYRPNESFDFRLGRMADSSFLMSDYLEVGYAFPWVRPPMEAYGTISPYYYDGADLTYSFAPTDGVWRLKASAGRIAPEIPNPVGDSYTMESDGLWSIVLIHERGPWNFRLGYSSFKLANEDPFLVEMQGLLTAFATPLNPFRDEALMLRDEFTVEGARVDYAALGARYDDGDWMFQVELSDLSVGTRLYPQGQRGYISVGRYLGSILPYFTYSKVVGADDVDAQGDWGLLGPEYAELQTNMLSIANTQRMAQDTLSLGMRWDFDSRAAFKLQWDHVRVQKNGWGLWSVDADRRNRSGEVDLFTLSLDFVF